MNSKLLNHLLKQEKYFVEEIARLLFCKNSLELFADSQNPVSCNGWLYMPAEPHTADWSLARILGSAEAAAGLIPLLPARELHLLVAPDQQKFFKGFKHSNKLLWLESHAGGCNEQSGASMPADLEIARKEQRVVRQNCSAFNPALYILKDKQVVAFAKTARESPNFVEIYIEVAPALRNKNLGSYLLTQMIKSVHELGKNLLYVVEENNGSSRRIAAKAGLREFYAMVTLIADRQNQ
jgi:ribosomal protein S18 acetylase RimI-like enzyme